MINSASSLKVTGGSDTTLHALPSLTLIEQDDFDTITRAFFRSKLGDLWYAETQLPLSLEEQRDPCCWAVAPRKVCKHIYPQYPASKMTLAPSTTGLYEKHTIMRERAGRGVDEAW
ncbi:hypothetical protein T440DRAFT_272095 [Plenodomus tracheiphilus IPT5]|uniref:Uncharacterized protein n=1 Tax=Plenodomus tracheiphilus IPT5 TaxID=1408161 RepID=A0A6A7BFK3_9PLEO|nr:hypothetical protein T440DRAFT_272095 [Plenodomus tracheiphilus IPT5]